jgi:hypothetical protein
MSKHMPLTCFIHAVWSCIDDGFNPQWSHGKNISCVGLSFFLFTFEFIISIKLILVYVCAFVGAVIYIYMCVCVSHCSHILGSQIIWTCSTLRECTHHMTSGMCSFQFVGHLYLKSSEGNFTPCYLPLTDVSLPVLGSHYQRHLIYNYVLVLFVPLYAMKTCNRFRGIAPPILILGTW